MSTREQIDIAEAQMQKLRMAGDKFADALATEYDCLVKAWMNSLDFEEANVGSKECGKSASVCKASLSLLHNDFTGATIHDLEDLHNEVKVCLLEIAGIL